MRIIVASTFVPFIHGGGRMIVDDLADVLRERDHQVEIVYIPFWSDSAEMLEQMLAIRLFDLTEWADRLICIRTPSYILKHPNKVLWFIHHHREAYDLWGTPYQYIPNTPDGLAIRNAIITADNEYLREAKQIYTNSKVVSERLRKFNNIESEVLYPPLRKAGRYQRGEFGNYIFYPSRIASAKRQELAIESMKYATAGVKLIVAGHPDFPSELEHIEKIVRINNLQSKVQLIGRWISEEQKTDLFANALGSLYIPFDEDSYGYVTLESFHSRKPVITCEDSGGTLEIVEDGVNGLVVPPEAQALAGAMNYLIEYKDRARQMGEAGYERMLAMNITWDRVVDCLLQ
jgi:glycosyltransferase involved in cell wall biosynthesis